MVDYLNRSGTLGDTLTPPPRRSPTTPRLARTAPSLAAFSFAFVAAMALLLLATAWWSRQDALQQAEREAVNLAHSAERQIARALETADVLLLQMQDTAQNLDWQDPTRVTATQQRLARVAQRLPYVFRLFIIDASGRVRLTSMEEIPPGITAADRDYFLAQREKDSGLYISTRLRSRASGEPIFVLSRRVSVPGGGFGGIVTASFEATELRSFYDPGARDLAPQFQVVGPDMTILLGQPTLPADADPAAPSGLRERIARDNPDFGTYETEGTDGRVWAYQRLAGHPLWITAGVSREAALEGWWQSVRYHIAFSVMALAGLGTLGFVAVRRAHREDIARLQVAETNVHLEERVRERTAALMARTRTLETINRVSTTLNAELDLERLLQAITDETTRLTGAEFGAFFYNIQDETGDSYQLYTLSGVPRSAFQGFPMPRSTPLFGPTFRGEGIIRIDDVLKDPRYGQMEPHRGMPPGHLPVRSYLAVPVISRSGEVLGGLFFGHSQRGVFTESAEQVVAGLAAQAAVALDNAQLHQALRESEDRLRMAVDATELGTFDYAPKTGALNWSDRAKALFGLPPDAPVDYKRFLAAVHPEHRDAVHQVMKQAFEPGGTGEYRDEFRTIGLEDGVERWIAARGRVVFEDGRPVRFTGTVVDMTDRKRGEEHLKLLIGELSHRVKNTLATVKSIALQTLRTSESTEAFRKAFTARLMALSHTHDLLSQSKWEGACLHDILLAEMEPYLAETAPRIVLDGDSLRLPPRLALTLSMVFHELTTNAIKYGALSTPAGEIRIRWTVEDAEGGRRLRLCWTESGGPPVKPPPHRSFGTYLIEHGVAHDLGGETRLAFEPEGVRCAMDVPLKSD